jgi:predicted lipoprotein with Yx(FWY)xxD motif
MTSGHAAALPIRVCRRLPLVALVLAVTVAAGCTQSGTAVSTPFGTSAPALQHGPTDEVKVATIRGLGPVLVDGQGITLYLYESDHQGSPSRCYNICAIQWPPLVLPTGVAAPIVGPGIEPRLLGTSPRTDGTTQITYNGWPLYLWPPDRTPGTATGQALTNAGGLWFVVSPAGNAVRTPLSA